MELFIVRSYIVEFEIELEEELGQGKTDDMPQPTNPTDS